MSGRHFSCGDLAPRCFSALVFMSLSMRPSMLCDTVSFARPVKSKGRLAPSSGAAPPSLPSFTSCTTNSTNSPRLTGSSGRPPNAVSSDAGPLTDRSPHPQSVATGRQERDAPLLMMQVDGNISGALNAAASAEYQASSCKSETSFTTVCAKICASCLLEGIPSSRFTTLLATGKDGKWDKSAPASTARRRGARMERPIWSAGLAWFFPFFVKCR